MSLATIPAFLSLSRPLHLDLGVEANFQSNMETRNNPKAIDMSFFYKNLFKNPQNIYQLHPYTVETFNNYWNQACQNDDQNSLSPKSFSIESILATNQSSKDKLYNQLQLKSTIVEYSTKIDPKYVNHMRANDFVDSLENVITDAKSGKIKNMPNYM